MVLTRYPPGFLERMTDSIREYAEGGSTVEKGRGQRFAQLKEGLGSLLESGE